MSAGRQFLSFHRGLKVVRCHGSPSSVPQRVLAMQAKGCMTSTPLPSHTNTYTQGLNFSGLTHEHCFWVLPSLSFSFAVYAVTWRTGKVFGYAQSHFNSILQMEKLRPREHPTTTSENSRPGHRKVFLTPCLTSGVSF